MTILSLRLRALAACLVAALMLLPTLKPASADASATAFVTSIYRAYVGKDAKGVPLNSRRASEVITPGLMKLIDADARAAKRRGEPPELNGDPFVDAQDWEIESFTVDVKPAGKNRARATVSIKGQPNRQIALDLVRLKGNWRIDDFVGPSGSVRKFLSKK